MQKWPLRYGMNSGAGKPLLVSILVPSYNYRATLPAALDSILRQTYPCSEIIIADDGSRDDSLAIAYEYSERYPGKIRVVTHPGRKHEGLEKTYRLALSQARGEIIAFLEADDGWHPEKLALMAEVFCRRPEVGVVYSDYQPFGHFWGSCYWKIYSWANRFSTPAHRPIPMLRPLLVRNPVASFSHFAVRRGLLDEVPVYESKSLPGNFDWWVLAHLSLRTRFYFIPEKLSYWRIHPGSAGYGRVTVKTLWRLHLFLRWLARSLGAMDHLLRATDPPDEEDTLIRRAHIKRALLFQNMIYHRRKVRLFFKILAHPVASLRFFCYIALKNLLVLPAGTSQ